MESVSCYFVVVGRDFDGLDSNKAHSDLECRRVVEYLQH
jgi:hypothetical protein